jgi:Flavin containing amine oxidoreductase
MRLGGAEFKVNKGCDAADLSRSGAVWLAGPEARQMAAASEEDVVDGVRAAFRAFPAAKIPQRFELYRTQWSVGPLSRGSYSYPAKECSGKEYDILGSPVTVNKDGRLFPVLQLAGEDNSFHVLLAVLTTQAAAAFFALRLRCKKRDGER